MASALQIDRADSVAIVTSSVETGEEIVATETGCKVVATEPIRAGHKVALVKLDTGDMVYKYGIPIGRMTSAIEAGGWISTHNLEDITEELCGTYCREFRDGTKTIKDMPEAEYSPRTINAFPRRNGTFGIRNYIMVIPTSPDCNSLAEEISDRTGCAWFVCDRTRLEDGALSDYTRNAMIFTGRNPNLYAVLVLGDAADTVGEEIARLIAEAEKPVTYMGVTGAEAANIVVEGTAIIEAFQGEAAGLVREPVPMDGFGLSVHCSGSDWTTALYGNSSVGAAADIVVKHGGNVYMTEWMEWSGSQHIMAEKCATRELGLELLDTVDSVRDVVLRETGLPVEHMNPAQANKDAGLTTLAEKSIGTIKKIGSTQIKGLLEYCEQPSGKGVWLPKHDSVWPPTTAIYGSLSGAHMSVLNTGIGFLYFELPHMLCIRTTGNTETFNNEAFKLDFNAGIVAEGKSIAETGEILFEYLMRIAEGDDDPKTEKDKIRAFNMYYYIENEFGRSIDRNRMLPAGVMEYQENCRKLTDLVK